MSITSTIQNYNKKFHNQYLEPSWGWGLRVALSVTVPLIWGAFSGKGSGAEWMAIAGECISFIELKGNVAQRTRLLCSASVLSVLFCIVGSVAGNFMWIALMGMLIVGFLSGLFKNLRDCGLGLALSVYIFYILSSAYPVATDDALWTRCGWVALGSIWTVLVGLASFVFIRIGTPYRRTIAAIWASVADLAEATGKGLDGRSPRSIRDIYLKEKEVRIAIDNSLALFEETLDQIHKSAKPKKDQYALAQARRIASLVSLHIIQISELTEQLLKHTTNRSFTLHFYSLFKTMALIGERMDVYLLTLKEEERILVISRLDRLRMLAQFIKEQPEATASPAMQKLVGKIAALTERVGRLVDKSLELLTIPEEKRVYKAYSFIQTLNILHPKFIMSNVKQLFNPDRVTTRYALRIGIAAFIGMLIGYALNEGGAFSTWVLAKYNIHLIALHHHGYWIPFTAIIVSQPYFGATLKKGVERSIGTIAGIVAGYFALMLPYPELTRFLIVFMSSIFLIYFLRRQYSVAAFFITLMLVGLLSMEPTYNNGLIYARLFCTIVGSVLAITAGFLLLPAWDKDALPKYLAESCIANYSYFQETFYFNNDSIFAWTKLKRIAETKNSNAYDSFTRFMQEVIGKKKGYANYYFMLTHNVRVTRELNNYHSEAELEPERIPLKEREKFYRLLNECDDLFRSILQLMRRAGNKFVEEDILKKFPKRGFNNIMPTENQVIFIEKIIMELKAIEAGLHLSTAPETDVHA